MSDNTHSSSLLLVYPIWLYPVIPRNYTKFHTRGCQHGKPSSTRWSDGPEQLQKHAQRHSLLNLWIPLNIIQQDIRIPPMSVEAIFNFSNTPHSTVNVRVASKDDERSVGTAVVYKSPVVGKGFIVGERTGIGGGFFWTMKVRKCIIVSRSSSSANRKRTYLVH